MHVSNTHTFTIILTQSRDGPWSRVLATQVADSGYSVFNFPLINILEVEDPIPLTTALRSLDYYSLSIFMSPNAINYALTSKNVIWPINLPIGVVGPGSVATLALHGIAKPIYHIISPSLYEEECAQYDSEHLYAAIKAEYKKYNSSLSGKRVLIFRGESGREWLDSHLRDAGADVLIVTVYRRIIPEPCVRMWERIHRLLKGFPHVWFITSSSSLQNLDKLARINLTESELVLLKRAPIITQHPRIERTAHALGFNNIMLTGKGDEPINKALCIISKEFI
ncbi:MAG: uroporphyrinogen-III synthase [Burkholderia sp.]|nr:uroporphyrinogen-III synthase [Burkholderia sp.]